MRTGATYIGTGWIRTSAMSSRFRPALPIELQCHIPPSKTVCSGLGQAFRWPVCGPHQSSTTTASPPVLCSSRTVTLIHCLFCRMEGATLRPGSWAGSTCGIYSPKEVGGRPSKGDSERRYGEKRLHLGIIAQFSIPYEYMQCQLYIACILCYIIPYIVIESKWAAENLYLAPFELLDIFGEHGPCIVDYSFCFLLGPFSS